MNFSKSITFIFLFFSLRVYALETENLCLTNRSLLMKAKNDLSIILLADETVDARRAIGCLEVNYRAYRKDLIHSYMHRRYRYQIAKSISNNKVRLEHHDISPKVAPMCRLQLEERGGGGTKSEQIQLGKQTKLKANQATSQQSIKREIVLSSGLPGTVSIDGEALIVNCFVRGNGHYHVSLNLGNKLITSVELQKGKELDIGQVVRKFHDDGKGVKGANIYKDKRKSKFKTKYYLSIK